MECRLVRKNINCCPLEITSHKSEMCLWKRAKIYFFFVLFRGNLCLQNILTPKKDTFIIGKHVKNSPSCSYDFLSPIFVLFASCMLKLQFKSSAILFSFCEQIVFPRDFRHSNLFCHESFSTRILISTSTILRTCE